MRVDRMAAPEPFAYSRNGAVKQPLDVFDVIELRCERVLDVNGEHFPVELASVNHGQDTQRLDNAHL